MTMLKGWTDAHTAKFQKEIMTFDHGLRDTGLFTDDALVDLLNRHPSELLDVCTRGRIDDPKYPNKLRTGDFRDCAGKDLIAAAKDGWVWINMRQAMNVHADYKAVLDDMYGGIATATGNKSVNPKGGILITSPVARTPFHFDKTEVILWHIRGKKRLFVYPLEEAFISDKDFEKALINPINDDLPYEVDFDKSAKVYDLQEGQGITWPLNSPHRVENNEFCVSVTTEYSTRESGLKNAAMIANATFREKFGNSSTYGQQSQAGRLVRSVFGRTIKKAGLAAQIKPKDMVSFKIDPNVPGFIVDTEPFERNF
ncbi:MAG: hypothetical protein ACSHXY_06595 [Alphaproteobacteria bacterium]